MAVFSLVQTLWTAQLPVLSQTAWLDVRRGTEPALIIHDTASGQQAVIALSDAPLMPGGIRYQALNGADSGKSLSINGVIRSLDGDTLARLATGNGSAMTYLDATAFAGNLAALHHATVGGVSYLYVGASYGEGISTYRVGASDTLTLVSTLGDTASSSLGGVIAINSISLGGHRLLVSASMTENGLSVFEMKEDGILSATASFGFAEALPVNRPSDLKIVETGGRAFVLLASFGTSSLTVLELRADGSLRFADQVADTQTTRFHNILAMDTISFNGQTLVAVAGGDGGVSLFQMLPDGQLLHRETLIDTTETALSGVRQLQFVQVGSRVELYALSTRDAGLTRLDVDLGQLGISGSVHTGTGSDDVLTAPQGGGSLQGLGGNDTLIDGAGPDTLSGGAGADTFVFRSDNETDTIADFNPAQDLIDLSGYQFRYDLTGVSFVPISGGISLRWDREVLTVLRDTGAPITAAEIRSRVLFATDHVIMPDVLPMQGTADNDTFIRTTAPQTIDGDAATTGIVLYLTDSSRNSGAAAGDILMNIESVTGTAYSDRITGDARANTLTGLQGDDLLDGSDGSDWLMPGPGNDTVIGGSGTDMVSFSDLTAGVRVLLAAGTAISGNETNYLSDIENVTGTILGDYIQGDDQNNRLRGLGDYDWFVGSAGQDSYDGGTGRDMISYVASPDGVSVDLGRGRGLAGQAKGDTYTSIERVTGSVFSDLFYGSDGEDDFRGLGGFDWFVGSGGGKDRYDGGTSVDTVAYSSSVAGVVASLLLGRGSAGDAARDLYTSIENLTGSSFDDILTGDNGRNVLRGLYGQDRLYGNGGVDRLEGGGSDDYLDGGAGWDYAIFSGNRHDYTITTLDDVTTVDRIAPGGDGTDTLINIEALQFADGFFFL